LKKKLNKKNLKIKIQFYSNKKIPPFLAHLERSSKELMGWRIVRPSINTYNLSETTQMILMKLHHKLHHPI